MEIEQRYDLIEIVGEGSFGWVYKAINKATGEVVALKELKQPCDPSEYLPEIRALTVLDHTNIVSLKGVEHADDTVFLAFEYMEEGSLHNVIQQRLRKGRAFSEGEIRSLSRQILQGLEFMHHKKGFMHRDLKPGNLLVNKGVVKISDMGTATELDSDQPFHHYVTTRFYRAPEVLVRVFLKDERLRPFDYDEKVDMWAVGAIMAELYLMCPVFMGENSDDQVHKIWNVIGVEGEGVGFRAVLPSHASDSAVDLIQSLCSWNPFERPTAVEALRHPFFTRAQNKEAASEVSNCTSAMNKAVRRTTKLSSMQPILGV